MTIKRKILDNLIAETRKEIDRILPNDDRGYVARIAADAAAEYVAAQRLNSQPLMDAAWDNLVDVVRHWPRRPG